jgi:hypothetical protein
MELTTMLKCKVGEAMEKASFCFSFRGGVDTPYSTMSFLWPAYKF